MTLKEDKTAMAGQDLIVYTFQFKWLTVALIPLKACGCGYFSSRSEQGKFGQKYLTFLYFAKMKLLKKKERKMYHKIKDYVHWIMSN